MLRFTIACLMTFCAVPAARAENPQRHAVRPAELIAVIGQADKIVVYGAKHDPQLYSSTNPKDIAELKDAIGVQPEQRSRCYCLPTIEIGLSRNGEELGVIEIQSALSIGFSRWSGEARPANPQKLIRWFDAHGVGGMGTPMQDPRAEKEANRLAADRWRKAMPSGVQPLWDKFLSEPWRNGLNPAAYTRNALGPALAEQYPDAKQRIRALFAWFGSGKGPWSGYPAYEDAPVHLLLGYGPTWLISALRNTTLTAEEMEGAARFFSGYTYETLLAPRPEGWLVAMLPPDLKKTLLDHAVKTRDQDNIERARAALER